MDGHRTLGPVAPPVVARLASQLRQIQLRPILAALVGLAACTGVDRAPPVDTSDAGAPVSLSLGTPFVELRVPPHNRPEGRSPDGKIPLRWTHSTVDNPFRETTRFELRLETAAPVRAAIYSASGRLIRVLHDGDAPAGVLPVTWSGYDLRGAAAPAGVYFLRVASGERTGSARVVLMR